MKLPVILACIGLAAQLSAGEVPASPADNNITIDLALLDPNTPVPHRIPMLTGPDGTVTLKLKSLESCVPRAMYAVVVETQVATIAPLANVSSTAPAASTAKSLSSLCDTVLEKYNGLARAKDERAVPRAVAQLKDALTAHELAMSQCEKLKEDSEELLGGTIKRVARNVQLKAGEDLLVTVTRAKADDELLDPVWKVVYSTGPRGRWLTSYGFTFILNRDDAYFAKALDGDRYRITAEHDRRATDFAPAVFFTWLPARGDFAACPAKFSAGLGFDMSNPVIFLGLAWPVGDNVTVNLGAVGHKQNRLNGKYEEGDIVTENLSSDQLHSSTFGASAYLGVSFRFESNPFTKAAVPK